MSLSSTKFESLLHRRDLSVRNQSNVVQHETNDYKKLTKKEFNVFLVFSTIYLMSMITNGINCMIKENKGFLNK